MTTDPLLLAWEILDDPDAVVTYTYFPPTGQHEFKGRCARGSFNVLLPDTERNTLVAALP